MNCSSAICAVASCMATRSGWKSLYVPPRSIGSVGSPRWLRRIFSVSVSGRPKRSRPAFARSTSVAYTPSTSSIGVPALTVISAPSVRRSR